MSDLRWIVALEPSASHGRCLFCGREVWSLVRHLTAMQRYRFWHWLGRA